MSESMRMWVEVIFNLGYLLAIYWLVWLPADCRWDWPVDLYGAAGE